MDANILTPYADAAALMKQQRILPIVGWEAAEKMLDLSLSAGSEASMVTRRWDTALDANTLTSYGYAAALMK